MAVNRSILSKYVQTDNNLKINNSLTMKFTSINNFKLKNLNRLFAEVKTQNKWQDYKLLMNSSKHKIQQYGKQKG